MEEHERLKWFLIKSFILLLVAAGLVEYVLLSLINSCIMPTIAVYFFPQAMDGFSMNGLQVAIVLLLVFAAVIIQGIRNLLPPGPGRVLEWCGSVLDGMTGRVIPEAGVARMDGQRRIVLLFFLIAVVFIMALPFLLGALIYARIVIRQFAEIQRLREEAKREYDRRRNLMLSDIAHDLRTPITTVAGYAAALSDGLVAQDRQKEYLDAIRNKAARMNDLITLLFDYVKLDSEGFKLEMTTFDLCELARENAALLYSDVEAAGMEFEIGIPESRMDVCADRLQLSRVLTNLLSNAVRHNPKGTRIGLSVHKEEEQIRVAVADTGVCIEDEIAEHLFEPFARGDEARTGTGSGLGLSIAQKAVRMHGWELALVQKQRLKELTGLERYTKAFLIFIKT